MAVEYAAKVTDLISHSNKEAGGWIGLGAGAAVVGVVLLASNPVGWVTAAGLVITGASTGASIGKSIGGRSRGSGGAGQVTTGAKSVFIINREAAFITSKADCHGDSEVVTGSRGVLIEGWNASRLGSRTSCAGYIMMGEYSVIYGDPEVAMPGHEKPGEEAISNALWGTEKGLGIAGLVSGGQAATQLAGTKAITAWSLVGAGAVQNAADIAGAPGAGVVGNVLDGANFANGFKGSTLTEKIVSGAGTLIKGIGDNTGGTAPFQPGVPAKP
ncbi:MAG: hypothetical protein HOW73_14195 [Polyangiaceae bacterium]|nr:hypothetical protein [Polyangiaceae bacterium]